MKWSKLFLIYITLMLKVCQLSNFAIYGLEHSETDMNS